MNAMLYRNVFNYVRTALFYRQVLMCKRAHHYSCISVKQALNTVPSGSIPVLIQVRHSAIDVTFRRSRK